MVSKDIIVNPFEVKTRVVIGATMEEALKYWRENIEPKSDLDIEKYYSDNGLML